ncbi:DNA-binding protein [Aliidiomarina shirensis]|uniref:DNA-binding protein n=1 Tax=Aliidiomarina shirensis TaxID=1048642 RepID=A0A432WT34_9GAMM|nr:nucleotide-binding protein [Aliidiomarina shirensis]RUO36935.1 DNA-binding protein [Aliidiomarina shirensis]
MFNLLISGAQDTWEVNPTKFSRERMVSRYEYTVHELADRYGELTEENIGKLKSYPCVFGYEGMDGFFRIGYIIDIRIRSKEVTLSYEFDPLIQPLPMQKLIENRLAFDITDEFEFNRTHWALKDVDLFPELVRCGFITQELANAATKHKMSSSILVPRHSLVQGSVFIVHGHDELSKTETARFVESLGLNAVILHEQINSSQTIIEKFEKHASEAAFAIVLLTPDDVGYPKDSPNTPKYRARQNVIFELGYFCAALSRRKISVLFKPGVEVPNDFSGVIYTPMDDAGGWKLNLAREMKACGLNVDLNKVL